ncbi:hypothetical protein COY61_01110 [bacterium (Candidatus Gribaldobacteria) CG_4_10_14_0_8_um_filter_33_9]|uniref:AbiEi antitoxin C-terminal domain-containing protein n=1 Tax=bacterium (Candidatus Gribaldobacteria) CG_4_10_14_0_8_um_filter_33_9 TaxID=2014266 RepID=A0A2M7RNE4_9BACT|nr:MAG: hypothetical protein COY61_01110 [bacterium (Candidatus Gribaldobacteria) CG_4_10_14_0_8_um_filter_33_9]
MRNKRKKPKTEEIISLVKNLPYFRIEDLKELVKKESYLKIFLSRFEKRERIFRLKKGFYVSKDFIDEIEKKAELSFYLEFLANLLYSPSYLSFEYVLGKYNALTEAVKNFTSVSTKKTNSFSNKFGNFLNYKIKKELFCGFKIKKNGGFLICEATKAKALFDFLYLRKNLILDKKATKELRINIEIFNEKDKKEFKKYIKIEGSEKLKKIFNWLFE